MAREKGAFPVSRTAKPAASVSALAPEVTCSAAVVTSPTTPLRAVSMLDMDSVSRPTSSLLRDTMVTVRSPLARLSEISTASRRGRVMERSTNMTTAMRMPMATRVGMRICQRREATWASTSST